jgi:RNA polymerase sigma-70 factor (ECF subfamily)
VTAYPGVGRIDGLDSARGESDSPPDASLPAVLARFEAPLIRYAIRFTQNLEQAREVVQDTFLKYITEESAGGLQSDDRLAAWLYRVCRNRAIDVRRKERRMRGLVDAELNERHDQTPAPDQVSEDHDCAAAILSLLGSLPENQQEVVRLKFQAGLRYKEIAEVTGLTASNVGFLLHVALKSIRERIHRTQTRRETAGQSAPPRRGASLQIPRRDNAGRDQS